MSQQNHWVDHRPRVSVCTYKQYCEQIFVPNVLCVVIGFYVWFHVLKLYEPLEHAPNIRNIFGIFIFEIFGHGEISIDNIIPQHI